MNSKDYLENALHSNDAVQGSCNHYDEHEQLLIEKVIEMLKTKPECFSAGGLLANHLINQFEPK